MKVIYNYTLDVNNLKLSMPIGAKILHVWGQDKNIILYAEVDTKASFETRYFEVFGTGFPMPEGNRVYLGTSQITTKDCKESILHIYENLDKGI